MGRIGRLLAWIVVPRGRWWIHCLGMRRRLTENGMFQWKTERHGYVVKTKALSVYTGANQKIGEILTFSPIPAAYTENNVFVRLTKEDTIEREERSINEWMGSVPKCPPTRHDILSVAARHWSPSCS